MPNAKQSNIQQIPEVIDTSILTNGRLIPPHIMSKIQEKVASGEIAPGRVTKQTLQKKFGIDSKYSVIVTEKNQIYGILPGVKQNMQLGSGTFGSVKLVQDQNGKFWALKNQKQTEQQKMGQVLEYQKLEILGQAGGVVTYESASKKQTTFAVVMELAQGVESAKLARLQPIQYANICAEAARALGEIHAKGLLHLDVKPENMIVDPVSGESRLIDFGASLIMTNGKVESLTRGSPLVMPPELLPSFVRAYFFNEPDCKHDFTVKTEMYPFGLTLANMLGLRSSKRYEHSGKAFNIHAVAQPGSPEFENNTKIPNREIREEVVRMLNRLIADKSEDRPDLAEVVTFFDNLVMKMNADPTNHLNVAIVDIKEFSKLGPEDRKNMINALREFDQVQLIVKGEGVDAVQVREVNSLLDAELIKCRSSVIHLNENVVAVAAAANEILQAEKLKNVSTFVTQQTLAQKQQELLKSTGVNYKKIEPIPVSQKDIRSVFVQPLPRKIDQTALQKGKLLSDKSINQIKQAIAEGKLKIDGSMRIPKAEVKKLGIKCNYNLIATKNVDNSIRLMAIYRGRKVNKQLGSGSFGIVKLVQDLNDGTFFAMKLQEVDERYRAPARIAKIAYDQEKANLAKLDQLVGAFSYKPVGATFKHDRRVILMPLANGSALHDMPANSLTQLQYAGLAIDVAKAIAGLHAKNLVHADLSLGNILRSADDVTLIDLASAVTVDPVTKRKETETRATIEYFAPEIAPPGYGLFSDKSDVYSYAITMAKLMGLSKSEGTGNAKRFVLVAEADPEFVDNKAIPDPVLRAEYLALFTKMTSANPDERPTMEAVIQSLQKIQQRLAASPKNVVKTAIVDLKELMQADAKGRAEIIDELKKYTEIKVIDTNKNFTKSDVQRILSILDDAEINVTHHVVYGSDSSHDLIQHIVKEDKSELQRDYALVTGRILSKESRSDITQLVKINQTKTAKTAEARIGKLNSSQRILNVMNTAPTSLAQTAAVTTPETKSPNKDNKKWVSVTSVSMLKKKNQVEDTPNKDVTPTPTKPHR